MVAVPGISHARHRRIMHLLRHQRGLEVRDLRIEIGLSLAGPNSAYALHRHRNSSIKMTSEFSLLLSVFGKLWMVAINRFMQQSIDAR
jgi:hypothetical protein